MLYSLREGLPEAVRHFLPHKGFYLQQNWEVIILDDGRSWCIILSVLFLALSFFGSLAATAIPEANDATLRERARKRSTSGLIITHTGHILQYVTADRGQVMYHGKLCCEDKPRRILDHIANHGYQECRSVRAGDGQPLQP